jgi:hypothetical protein
MATKTNPKIETIILGNDIRTIDLLLYKIKESVPL